MKPNLMLNISGSLISSHESKTFDQSLLQCSLFPELHDCGAKVIQQRTIAGEEGAHKSGILTTKHFHLKKKGKNIVFAVSLVFKRGQLYL